FRPQMVANQIRPPGFLPVQNTQNNFNRGNNFKQNRGGNFNQSNFNQSQLHQPQVNQPLGYQALAYQAPVSQTQSVSQNEFKRYIKANDAVLRNIQNQGQSTQNQCQRSGTLPDNTVTNPKEDLKGITTRSGVAYQGPTIPTPSNVAKQGTEVTKDQVQTSNSQSTAPVQPTVTQSESETLVSEPVVAPVSASMPNLKLSIPYPSRCDNERCRDQANEQIKKFYKIFKDMSFEISFTDALMLMPRFAFTLKALIGNKEKLSEMARTSINEHCSAVILNKLPRKLEDPDKFLIPCEFPGMEECLALADLDVKVKVGVFHFPANFVVVDFEPDPRVPLILRSPTPSDDPIFSTTSPTLTPFRDSDFLLFEEADDFLGLEDDPDSLKLDPSYYDPKGDILLLEAILNSDPSPPLPNHEQSEADAFLGLEDDPDSPKINPFYYNPGDILLLEAILNSEPSPPLPNHEKYLPSYKKELKVCEAKTVKSFVDEPPEVELKDLPPHLEYAFIEGDSKLPVIIAKELGDEEKSALIMVLKSQKRAIAWKLSDIQGGFTVVENEENELIPTRLVTGWRVLDTKGAENLAAENLSRLENPYENVLDPKEINETFPLETLSMVTFRGDSNALWFADFANNHAGNFIIKGNRFYGPVLVFTREQVYSCGGRLFIKI
nr:reverse transcriptase domain-containing protein [Tanacetum cinerariifolium]